MSRYNFEPTNYDGMTNYYKSDSYRQSKEDVAPRTPISELHRKTNALNPFAYVSLPKLDALNYSGIRRLRPPSEIDAHAQNTMGFDGLNTSAEKVKPPPFVPQERHILP